mgnify:CR=1 FL=1
MVTTDEMIVALICCFIFYFTLGFLISMFLDISVSEYEHDEYGIACVLLWPLFLIVIGAFQTFRFITELINDFVRRDKR